MRPHRAGALRSLALLSAALVGACASSPPMRFYTLTPIAPEAPSTAPPGTVPVRLNRVTVPGELDRLQLVRQIDATRLQIDDQDRWAAPLDDMIRRVLSADLVARLSASLVVDANESPVGERAQTLSVDVQEFYADPSCAVTLRATWVLRPPHAPGPSAQGGPAPQVAAAFQSTEQTQVPSAGACSAPDAVPQAMSRALGLLSDRIAAAIAESPGTLTPGPRE